MHSILLIVHIIVGILMVLTILVQEKGAGLGEAIGGSGGVSTFKTQKRGAEKVLANLTFGLIFIFLVLSIVLNFV